MRRLLAPLLLALGLVVASAAPASASTLLVGGPVPIRATCTVVQSPYGPLYKITWYATESTSTAATAEVQVFRNGSWLQSYDVWVPLDPDGGYATRHYGPTAYASVLLHDKVRGIAYLNIQTVVGGLISPEAIDGC